MYKANKGVVVERNSIYCTSANLATDRLRARWPYLNLSLGPPCTFLIKFAGKSIFFPY